ncbi:MAG TPA: hypothetical protein VFT01_03925 [Homoserinimonas sp.]|nr:hypothetical protein [Homoserinimonas sp.]
MYLRDLLAGLRRRWYLVIVGLLLSAGLAWYVFTLVPVSYSARLSVLLLPPETVTGEGENPFLNLSGMAPAMDVLTRRVDADVVRSRLEAQFPEAGYIVFADSLTSGPMVVAETTAPTAPVALKALDAVNSELVASLDSMQADLGVPPPARITLTDVAVDRKATLDTTNRTQFVLAAGAAGLGITILLTGIIDGLIMARRARQSDALAVETAEPGADLPPLR